MVRPQPDLVLFLDECLGTTDVAEALKSKEIKVQAFVKAYPRIYKLFRNFVPPFVAIVRGDGTVQLLANPPRRASIRRSEDF